LSQKEQWEVTCRRCARKDILDHEPPKDYVCPACGPIPEPVIFSKDEDKPYKIDFRPKTWTCGNHHQTFKVKEPCPECEKEFTKHMHPKSDSVIIPNIEDEKVKAEMEMGKAERAFIRNSIKKRLDLEQAQLDTANLLKQLIKKTDELAKDKEDKNGA